MSVIARTSSFAYRDRPVRIQEIGRELGVDYVLEGSVQRSGKRIRINAQLIEAATGTHLLAERFERESRDLYSVQDEITRGVAVELAVKLTKGEVARINFKSTDNIAAYDYFLRGMDAFEHRSKTSFERARTFFEKAIEHDPRFVRAIVQLGWVYVARRFHHRGWGYDPKQSLQQAEALARRALAIDENASGARALMGRVNVFKRQFDEAVAEGRRAVSLEPNDPDPHIILAWTMLHAGRPKDATRQVARALCLSPYPSMALLTTETFTHYMSGRYEAAIATARKMLARNLGRELVSRRRMIASYMALGRKAEARAEAGLHKEYYMKRFGRPYSLKRRLKTLRDLPWKYPSWIDVHADRLRRAGIPD